jgi:hypothetical protein
MFADNISPEQFGVHGHVTLWAIDEATGLKLPICAQPNQIQYSWGFVAAKQLGRRQQPERPDYSISAMYIEYENQSDPESAVSEASNFPRTLGVNYYNSLGSSTNRDFLRVPIIVEPAISVSAGFESYLDVNQQGNKLTFFVQTSGAVGAHGRAFSDTVNSKVFAAALVAAPVFSDRTKDVIFARTVFSSANQVTKEASSQIGITWDISFE